MCTATGQLGAPDRLRQVLLLPFIGPQLIAPFWGGNLEPCLGHRPMPKHHQPRLLGQPNRLDKQPGQNLVVPAPETRTRPRVGLLVSGKHPDANAFGQGPLQRPQRADAPHVRVQPYLSA